MTTQRDSFFDKLFELAKENRDIILISADMGAPSLDRFRKELPDQYVDCGIAEQSAILTAVGLAKAGKKCFMYAIAPFCVYRILEQIRINLCGMNLPITICGVGAGMSYDDSGPTHHETEGIAQLRCLPNIRIHNITDPIMARYYAEASVGFDYPNYIRLDRQANDILYGDTNDFSKGYLADCDVDNDLTIIATGNMAHIGREIQKELSCNFVDVFEFPINNSLIAELESEGCYNIVTLEEHVLPGGLGSAMLEAVNDVSCADFTVLRFGLDFSAGFCYQYGGREELQKAYGIDKASILRRIEEWV